MNCASNCVAGLITLLNADSRREIVKCAAILRPNFSRQYITECELSDSHAYIMTTVPRL